LRPKTTPLNSRSARPLTQISDKTQVTRLLSISGSTVGSIVERVVARPLDPERLSGLRRIGTDESGYRKHHRYLMVVVDHNRRRVAWTGEGKSSETLAPFFEVLGEKGCLAIEIVTIDRSAAFIKAVRERLPQAEVGFDRFHVQRLAFDAVDEVRRSIYPLEFEESHLSAMEFRMSLRLSR